MSNELRTALTDTLDYLQNLCRDIVRPAEAQARLRPLQARHPQIDMDLL